MKRTKYRIEEAKDGSVASVGKKNESFAMDKTIYFILSKQSRMQTGLYFQLVVVTKCKQYFHVSSTLSTLVLYYSISHCSPRKNAFHLKKLGFSILFTSFTIHSIFCLFLDMSLKQNTAKTLSVGYSCMRVSRAPVAFPVSFTIFIPYLNQRKYVKPNTLPDESAQSSALRQTTTPLRECSSLCVLLWLYVARLLIQKR